MKYLLLLLLLTACAKSPEYTIDPELQPYVDAFTIDAQKHGIIATVPINVVLRSIGQPLYGVCRITDRSDISGTSVTRTITINSYWWASATEDSKQDVIYHEMAHCVLRRGHDNSKKTFTRDGIEYEAPKSLMFTSGLSRQYPEHYAAFRQYYIDELFSAP